MEQFKKYGAGCVECKEPITIDTQLEERRYLSNGMCKTCEEKTIGEDRIEIDRQIWDDFIDRIDLLLVVEQDRNDLLMEIRDAIRHKRS